MIIVQMSGGLGNQMFQYALYKQLESMGKEIRIDDITCYSEQGNRPKQIAIFPVSYIEATKEELIALTDASLLIKDRIRRKLFGRKTKAYQEKQFNYDKTVLELTEAYFEGCWQTEKYFPDVKELLKNEFQFPVPEDVANQSYLDQIHNTISVGIHIRRGDYLVSKYSGLYEGICTPEYYQKAIAQMQAWHPECHFFLFSNDADWVREQYQGNEYTVVDCNDEETGYYDMMLMSHCKHQIIANSSFSWWAAWLNTNIEKKVIAPSKWLNGRDCSDIYTDGMLAI